jgi:nucleoside-diphosphate-sugar epimerase
VSGAPGETPPADGQAPCLITGASGFIGGRLAARMAAQGRAVRCLARESSDVSALLALGVPVVRGDLLDRSSLRAATRGCRQVVHCAALVSDWAGVAEIRAANVTGTRNLLEAAAEESVARFVQVSTTDIYGHPGNPSVDEAATPPPGAHPIANWYAQSKLEAEQLVRQAAEERALEAVILRPATVYGPGSEDVVGEIARAIRGGHMLLIGGGRTDAGLCYVENLIDAILLALDRPVAASFAFNVTDGLSVSWRRFTADLAAGLGSRPPRLSIPYPLAHLIGRAMEGAYRLLHGATGLTTPPLLSRQAVQVLGREQDFSTELAQTVLGWRPRVSYADGIAATLDWLRAPEAASQRSPYREPPAPGPG